MSRRMLAAFVSLILPGVGHAMLGQAGRGALWTVAPVLCVIATQWIGFWGLPLILIVPLGAAVDAFLRGEPEEPPGAGEVFKGFFILGGALLLALLLLRGTFLQTTTVADDGMRPAVHPGATVAVSRASYGFKLPFTKFTAAANKKLAKGDVVAFASPRGGAIRVGRVVADSNEPVEFLDGELRINGRPPVSRAGKEKTVRAVNKDGKAIGRKVMEMEETLGMSLVVIWKSKDTANWPGPDRKVCDDLRFMYSESKPGECIVPPNHVFIANDNRAVASDSREYGPVPVSEIIGKAYMVLLPGEGGSLGDKIR